MIPVALVVPWKTFFGLVLPPKNLEPRLFHEGKFERFQE